jgi:hypothetical protein
MATRTIELDRNDLDKSIEVLSTAAEGLRLTRFERLSYQALIASVDWIAACVFILAGNGVAGFSAQWNSVFGSLLIVGVFVGLFSLALNIQLFRRVFRERARLKKLGLSSLSRSLWKESRRRRRSQWISLAHGTLLIFAGIILLWTLVFVIVIYTPEDAGFLALGIFIYLVGASLLFAARYLRNQRERMDLTANAEELRKTFQSLRQRAGKAEVVTVPSELVEQAAKIESAQIARERKDAVLQSVTFPSKEYPVAFDRDAVEQRASLSIADRIELADLIEQLSKEAAELESQAGAVAGAKDATLRGATKSGRVEIDYVIDRTSPRIRINAVRQGSSATSSPDGASHA